MRTLFVLLLFGLACAQALAASDPPAAPQDALFGALPMVEAASLHSQTLEEAPANVSIVTSADIRKYGYRTLSEVLSGVRGFFTSYDRIYHYVGVGGFSLLGDYNTRFLVMLNGHPLTSAVYDSNGSFGQDLGIDLDLVSRIEIIRGPTSALYGSNGILANINIVTKSPVDVDRYSATTETGSFGERKAGMSSSIYLGGGANLLISASVFNNAGASLTSPDGGGPVAGVDGEKGYHSFGQVVWHNWSFTAFFNNRVKQPPVAWGEEAARFHRGDSVRDSRNFVAVSHTSELGGGKLRWQSFFDQYKYDDRIYYPGQAAGDFQGEFTDVRSTARGESVGTQLSWQRDVGQIGELTLGGVANLDLRNLQQDRTVYPVAAYSPAIEHPDLTGALFAQQQWKVASALTLYGGVRLDASRLFGASISPRLALVYQAAPRTTFKAVYGRPFRNPSTFERYYTDGGKSFLANPGLRSETGVTLELSAEHKLLSGLSAIVEVYDYQLSRMIIAEFLPGSVAIYGNSGRNHSQGVQVELNAKAGSRLETNASYSFQQLGQGSAAPYALPRHVGQFRIATPFFARRVWLAGSVQYMSARETLSEDFVRPVALGDITVSTSRLHPNFDLIAGIRNLAGWRYQDPVALGVDRMPQDGRSVFLKLIYHARD